ncbi:MAG: hypothetical protein HC771_22090 [Synechococcales cyanobacterium CRU_2_2]|nr:hypothetical protein [Synechococcales cyanobacterium CRU_2_2]
MTGFIRGLFGKKQKAPESPKEAFFLDDDAAKSLGDLDFMRNPNTIRRTFPKSASSPEKKEFVQDISATEKVIVRSEGKILSAGGVKAKVAGSAQIQPKTIAKSSFTPTAPTAPAAPTPTFEPAAPTFQPQPKSQPAAAQQAKRSPDSSMDLFRKMAKDIKS